MATKIITQILCCALLIQLVLLPDFLYAQSADAERVAKLLSIDLDAMRREPIEELPEPKGWARDAPKESGSQDAKKANGRRRRV